MRLSRRTLLRTVVATTALAAPFVRGARAAAQVVPSGSMALPWHTNLAPRWLDPLQHDGGATPDNFLNAVDDALIKNFRDKKYDHLALADRFDFTERREERHISAPRQRQVPRRLGGLGGRRQMELRAISRRLGQGAARFDRTHRDRRPAHGPFRFQGAVPQFSAADRYRQCLRRRMGGAGQVLRKGRAGRVRAEARRCRALQADRARAGHQARIRGL